MRDMTHDEWRTFLLARPHTAKVATVAPDGRPHVTPIWFDLDGDDVIFTTGHTSLKARSLQHDARVAVCVDDEQPPFAYVLIDGTASMSDDLPELRRWATRIGGRHMGPEGGGGGGGRKGV